MPAQDLAPKGATLFEQALWLTEEQDAPEGFSQAWDRLEECPRSYVCAAYQRYLCELYPALEKKAKALELPEFSCIPSEAKAFLTASRIRRRYRLAQDQATKARIYREVSKKIRLYRKSQGVCCPRLWLTHATICQDSACINPTTLQLAFLNCVRQGAFGALSLVNWDLLQPDALAITPAFKAWTKEDFEEAKSLYRTLSMLLGKTVAGVLCDEPQMLCRLSKIFRVGQGGIRANQGWQAHYARLLQLFVPIREKGRIPEYIPSTSPLCPVISKALCGFPAGFVDIGSALMLGFEGTQQRKEKAIACYLRALEAPVAKLRAGSIASQSAYHTDEAAVICALLNLGRYYAAVEEREKDLHKARCYLMQAFERSDGEAVLAGHRTAKFLDAKVLSEITVDLGRLLVKLGRMYEAVSYLERGCESGNVLAAFVLGVMWSEGFEDVKPDAERAAYYLTKSARAGHGLSVLMLIKWLVEDPSLLVGWELGALTKAARRIGCLPKTKGIRDLCLGFLNGYGLDGQEKNLERGVYHFNKATACGFRESEVHLARLYEHHHEYKNAAACYERAWHLGILSVIAPWTSALIAMETEESDRKALTLLKGALSSENPTALARLKLNLARVYLGGRLGGEGSNEEILNLLLESDDPQSFCELANIYQEGRCGVQPNLEVAREYMTKYILGLMPHANSLLFYSLGDSLAIENGVCELNCTAYGDFSGALHAFPNARTPLSSADLPAQELVSIFSEKILQSVGYTRTEERCVVGSSCDAAVVPVVRRGSSASADGVYFILPENPVVERVFEFIHRQIALSVESTVQEGERKRFGSVIATVGGDLEEKKRLLYKLSRVVKVLGGFATVHPPERPVFFMGKRAGCVYLTLRA